MGTTVHLYKLIGLADYYRPDFDIEAVSSIKGLSEAHGASEDNPFR